MVEDNPQNNPPLVSIVIPVLNCAAEVDDCIQALRRLDYPQDRYEIVVVDNGSTDGTVERLRQAGIEPHVRQERGRSRALNTGLQQARGEIICSTDISCRPEPQWIREIVKTFEDPAVGCVAGEIKLLRTTDARVIDFQERHDYMSPLSARHRIRPPFLPYADGANASFRRAVFETIGPFDETFIKAADVEICYRMLFLTDYKIAFSERAVVWEPGEESLRALLKQRFRIGIGNILLQKKFASLFGREAGGNRLRRAYWRLRSGLGELGRLALHYPRAVLFRCDRVQAYDLSVTQLMGITQRLGRWYGRWYVHRRGLRPEPVDPLRIEPYVDGRIQPGARIVG